MANDKTELKEGQRYSHENKTWRATKTFSIDPITDKMRAEGLPMNFEAFGDYCQKEGLLVPLIWDNEQYKWIEQ